MYFKINDKFEISIFDDGNSVPFWFQPDYPNGDSFDSLEEATTWAQLAIASYGENEPYPPNGKGLPCEPKIKVTRNNEGVIQ